MNAITRKLLVICASSLCQLALAESEQRDLDGFSEVAVSSGINLEIRQGENFAVEVDSSEGDVDNIVTEVVGDTLRIYVDRSWTSWLTSGFLDWFDDYDVAVSLPELTALRASGGADVNGSGIFTGARLELRSSGGSDIELTVEVDSVDVTTSGGSDISLAGSANRASARTSGGSDLDASRLSVKDADLTSSGGSDIDMTVTAKLDAKASGGSDIVYSGDPELGDIDTSGGAEVTHR